MHPNSVRPCAGLCALLFEFVRVWEKTGMGFVENQTVDQSKDVRCLHDLTKVFIQRKGRDDDNEIDGAEGLNSTASSSVRDTEQISKTLKNLAERILREPIARMKICHVCNKCKQYASHRHRLGVTLSMPALADPRITVHRISTPGARYGCGRAIDSIPSTDLSLVMRSGESLMVAPP